jgi:hypothetical protein
MNVFCTLSSTKINMESTRLALARAPMRAQRMPLCTRTLADPHKCSHTYQPHMIHSGHGLRQRQASGHGTIQKRQKVDPSKTRGHEEGNGPSRQAIYRLLGDRDTTNIQEPFTSQPSPVALIMSPHTHARSSHCGVHRGLQGIRAQDEECRGAAQEYNDDKEQECCCEYRLAEQTQGCHEGRG